MKIFNIFFLTLLSLNFFSYSAQRPVQAPPQKKPAAPARPAPGAKMPPISEAELQEMLQVLETLDQETLDALAKIGEDYIKEMESQGKDPFQELFGVPTPPELKEQQTAPVAQPMPELPKLEQPKPIELPKMCLESKELQGILKNLIAKINAISHKAESNRAYADKLKEWKYNIQDMLYYFHALAEDKLLKYLPEKEFAPLCKTLRELEQALNYLEPLFIVKEVELEEVNPYTLLGTTTDASWQEVNKSYQKLYTEKSPQALEKELKSEGKSETEIKEAVKEAQKERETFSEAYNIIMQKEQTKQVFDSILQNYNKAIYQNNLIKEMVNVLSKYEPEALKLKQEQEELEKKARQAQEEALRVRYPSFSPRARDLDTGFFGGSDFLPGYEGRDSFKPSFDGPAGQTGKPAFEPTKIDEGKEPSKASAKKPEAKKDEKGKDKGEQPKKPAPRKPDTKAGEDKLKTITKNFEALERSINEESMGAPAGKELFKGFAAFLEKDPSENTEYEKAKNINNRLLEMERHLRAIKNELSPHRMLKIKDADKKLIEAQTRELWHKYFPPKDKDKKDATKVQPVEIKPTEEKGEEEKEKKKESLRESLGNLLNLSYDRQSNQLKRGAQVINITPLNRYLFMGQPEEEALKSTRDEKTKGIINAIRLDSPVSDKNFLADFLNAFTSLDNQFKQEKKPAVPT
ncbi:MAG: hypothetical protein AB7R69_02315, partial [Candidatus Babeliales bacterium]